MHVGQAKLIGLEQSARTARIVQPPGQGHVRVTEVLTTGFVDKMKAFMNQTSIAFGLLMVLNICCSTNRDQSELRIKTTQSVSTLTEEVVSDDRLSTVTNPYFEVTLSSVNGGAYHIAGKELSKSWKDDTLRLTSFFVVDSVGTVVQFNGATEFLNYVAQRGYDLTDQKQGRYSIDYTFKRR